MESRKTSSAAPGHPRRCSPEGRGSRSEWNSTPGSTLTHACYGEKPQQAQRMHASAQAAARRTSGRPIARQRGGGTTRAVKARGARHGLPRSSGAVRARVTSARDRAGRATSARVPSGARDSVHRRAAWAVSPWRTRAGRVEGLPAGAVRAWGAGGEACAAAAEALESGRGCAWHGRRRAAIAEERRGACRSARRAVGRRVMAAVTRTQIKSRIAKQAKF